VGKICYITFISGKESFISKKITINEFSNMLSNVNSNISIVGNYVDTKTKVLMKCNICGNEWMALPYHLLRGHGCPRCGIKNRVKHTRTHEEFVKELQNSNAQISLLSTYHKSRERVLCKCNLCGLEWSAYPYNLLSGYGCPSCGNYNSKIKNRNPEDNFISKLSKLNKDIRIIGDYQDTKTPVKCKCLICGNTWIATPSNLTNAHNHGTGCPRCRSSHGEKIIAQWLDDYNYKYDKQKKFDDLIGTGGGLLSYDFYLSDKNLLIEYQGEFHDWTTQIQTEDDFLRQVEHDRLKKEYADSHNINILYIWYYEIHDIYEILNRNIM